MTEKEKTHWEQVRIQAAIAVVQGLYANPDAHLTCRTAAETAVKQADVLIDILIHTSKGDSVSDQSGAPKETK